MGLWRSWKGVAQKDAYFDMVFNQVVRGRSALQVAWIANPEQPDPWQPPILFRSLNPKNVGFLSDDTKLLVAYHTYEETVRKLRVRYPEIVNLKEVKDKNPKDTICFTDYWWRDGNEIYNCYLINNTEFLRSPKKSELPLIPIIVRSAQEFPVDEPGERVHSFLHDIGNDWKLECELQSMMMTGLKQSFWPEKFVRNRDGQPVGDLVAGPGAINEVAPTFEFVPDAPRAIPDFQSAMMLLAGVKDRLQKSSFADSLFGLSDSSARSGFMLHQLTQAGMSILGSIVQAIAGSMMAANSIALCMVKKFSAEGETIYAFDDENNSMRGYNLTSEQVHDSYENHVLIKPAPSLSDDMQKLAIGIQLVVNGIVSSQTVRENLIPFNIPSDELQRIHREMVMKDPDLVKEMVRQSFRQYTGYDLPPGEPDFQKTPASPQPGAPSPGIPLQPDAAAAGMNLPPEAQGQVSPEMMTGDADVDPRMLDLMQGQNIDPRQVLG
jgi:hypothetical protein